MTPETSGSSGLQTDKVQKGLALINPRLFGSKVELSESDQADLDRIIENPYRRTNEVEDFYFDRTGFCSDDYYKQLKLGEKPKVKIESQSATVIGQLIIELSDRIRGTKFAGVSKKGQLKEIISMIEAEMEEATMPAEFGRNLNIIETDDMISQSEQAGLSKVLSQLEKDIEAIPSKYKK